MFGFGFGDRRREPASAIFDPATDNLSLWLRSDDAVNGAAPNYSNFRWGARAAASSTAPSGASNNTKGFVPRTGYGDAVFRQSTAQLNGYDTVEWPVAAAYPAIHDEDSYGRHDYFGPYLAHPSAPSTFDTFSYTISMVVQPLASSTNGQSGGNVTFANAALIGGFSEYLAVVLLSDTGTIAKFGITHYDAVANVLRPSPVWTWTGGFGAWGLLQISYDAPTETLIVRVNGATIYSGTFARTRTAVQGRAIIGCSDGGTNKAKFRTAEVMYSNTSKTLAQVQTRETYFKNRYPALGIP